MATSTRQVVREYMMDHFSLGRRGTNTGTSQTAITDDPNFGGHAGAEGIEVGSRILITSGNRDGDERRLSSRPKLTTGVANVDPDFGDALSNTDTFEIAYRPLVFGGNQYSIHGAMSAALLEFAWERRVVPVTLVADGDVLSTGTTDWTAVDGAGGSDNPTLAKVSASFPLGERVLSVTNNATGAGDFAQSANIAVEELKSYYLEVGGMIGSGGAAADAGTLVLFDVTNGAAITLDAEDVDINRFEPELLVNNAQIPSGCEQVQIRLTCTAVGDIITWTHVIFRKNESRQFVLTDRPQRVNRIGRVFATNTSTWSTRGDLSEFEVGATPEQLDNGIFRLNLKQSVSGMSVWYEEFVQIADMASDAGTTTIPKEWLAAVAAEKLLKPMQRLSKEWAARYDYAALEAAGIITAYHHQVHKVKGKAQTRYPLVSV